jgi:hypothetical protein
MGILKKGDKGSKVKSLQKKLNKVGTKPKVSESGTFDDATEKAVRAFQKRVELKPDGKVGTATMEALDKGGKRVKWTIKDTMSAHKQMNRKIADLAKDRKLIEKLAKKRPKDKDLQHALRNYRIYADALAEQMDFMKKDLELIDLYKFEFDGLFGSSPKSKPYFLGQAQDTWKALIKRNKGAAKLERAYNFEHDAFLKALDNVPA